MPQPPKRQPAIQGAAKDLIQPVLFWPNGGDGVRRQRRWLRWGFGGGDASEDGLQHHGDLQQAVLQCSGARKSMDARWRPQSMESEAPGVFAFTVVLGENRPAFHC